MGLYDRDYYRNEPRGSGLLGGAAPICKWLIAINIVVYVLQLVTGPGGGISRWLLLDPNRVLGGFEIWRLLTYAFCHDVDSPWHLIFNMWMLWLCGAQVEPIYGPREFLRFYLTAAVAAGIAFVAFGLAVARLNALWGASGAVLATTVVCAMYYPTQRILVMFVFPLELRWLVLVALFFDLYPVLLELGGGRSLSNVGHAAHLGGALYGYLYKAYDLRFSRLLAGTGLSPWRGLVRTVTRKTPSVRLYEPPATPADSAEFSLQVDQLLEKISQQGESSLTDAERQTLKEASRRYKRK